MNSMEILENLDNLELYQDLTDTQKDNKIDYQKDKIAFVPIMVPENEYLLLHKCLQEKKVPFFQYAEKPETWSNSINLINNELIMDNIKLVFNNIQNYFFVINNNKEYSPKTAWIPSKCFFVKKGFLNIYPYYENEKSIENNVLKEENLAISSENAYLRLTVTQSLASYCASEIYYSKNSSAFKKAMIGVSIKKDALSNEIFCVECSTKKKPLYLIHPDKISAVFLRTQGMSLEEYKIQWKNQENNGYKNEIIDTLSRHIIVSDEDISIISQLFKTNLYGFSINEFYKASMYLYNVKIDEIELTKFIKEKYQPKISVAHSNAQKNLDIIFNMSELCKIGDAYIPTFEDNTDYQLINRDEVMALYSLYTNFNSSLKDKTGLFYLLQYFNPTNYIINMGVPLQYLLGSLNFNESEIYSKIMGYMTLDFVATNDKDVLFYPQFYCPMFDEQYFRRFMEHFRDKGAPYGVEKLIVEVNEAINYMIEQKDSLWWIKKDDNPSNNINDNQIKFISSTSVIPPHFILYILISLEKIAKTYLSNKNVNYKDSIQEISMNPTSNSRGVKIIKEPKELYEEFKSKIINDIFSYKTVFPMEEWRKELFASKETIQYAMYMKAKQLDTQNKTKSINQLLKETSREKLINDYYLTQVKRRKNVPTISKDILRKVKNKKNDEIKEKLEKTKENRQNEDITKSMA